VAGLGYHPERGRSLTPWSTCHWLPAFVKAKIAVFFSWKAPFFFILQLQHSSYEVDPLVCPKCGSEMKVVAVITVPSEVNKILECLKRNNAPPLDKGALKAS
jgi:hypothetical protein